VATNSTEDTVRSPIIAGIQSIATTSLGFADSGGNIQSKLLEFAGRTENAKLAFLMANITGKSDKQLRCWAVQVTAQDNLFADFASNANRLYLILVRGYYWPEEVNMAIQHARYVRGAIKDLGTTLSSTVDRTLETLQSIPTIERAPDGIPSEEMCIVDLELTAEARPAQFT